MAGQGTLTEAVAYFENAEDLQGAIDELETSGFDRSEISLLASEEAVEKKLGHWYARPGELEDDSAVPRQAFVSTEAIGDAEGGLIGGLMYLGAVPAAGAVVASGGTLAAAIAAAIAAGGGGGLIGWALAETLGRKHAEYIEKQLEHGGLLLWVRTRDQEHEKRATEILGRHSGHDVHIHALPDHA